MAHIFRRLTRCSRDNTISCLLLRGIFLEKIEVVERASDNITGTPFLRAICPGCPVRSCFFRMQQTPLPPLPAVYYRSIIELTVAKSIHNRGKCQEVVNYYVAAGVLPENNKRGGKNLQRTDCRPA